MAYRIIQKQSPRQQEIGNVPGKESSSQNSEIGWETIPRTAAIASTGPLAAIPGFAGNIAKTVNDLIAAPITKHVFGQEPVPYEQTPIGKLLPTTHQHQKNIEEGIPYLKPRNRVERVARDFTTDTAELFLPGKAFKMEKYAMTPFRSLGISAAANTAGVGTELWTGDKSKGDMVKGGSMFLLSLFNPMTAKNITSNLYKSAQASLPQNASTNAAPLMGKLNALETKILQGRDVGNLAPSEKFVIDQINKFKNLIQNGQVKMESLVAQKRSLSEELTNHLFDAKDRATKARAKELAQQITHDVRDTMAQYGKQNPQWWGYQQSADKAFAAIQKSNYISRSLEKFMKGRPEMLAHVFGVGIPAGLGYVSAPAGAASVLGYLATKLGTRIVKSPELAKHYAKVVGAAAADNPKLVHKELDELEEKIQKDQSKSNKFKIVKKQSRRPS